MRMGSVAAVVGGAIIFLIIGIAIGRGGGGAPRLDAAPEPAAATQGAPETGPAPVIRARAADAPRAAPPAEAGLAFVAYRPDTSGPAPVACFAFNAPLDAGVDYAPFVALDPAAPAAFSVAGDSLCLGGLEFGSERVATLRAGLPDAEGRELAADEAVPVTFDDRPAYVGFKGDGVVLPRRDADGLAVETVNVERLAVRVSRVNDRALVFKRITEGQTTPEGRYAWSYGEDDPSDVAETVWRGEIDTPGARNTPATTVFPLGAAIGTLEPGAYHVALTDASKEASSGPPPASAERWIVLTDLALTAYRGADGLDVIARSLQSARAARGARLQLVARNNAVLAEALADPFGRVRFAGPLLAGEGPEAPRMVFAFGAEGDFAVLDLQRSPLDLSGQDIDGRAAAGEAEAFVYLDRGVFRPGESVRATALLRDAQGRALPERAGALVVYRPNGLEAARRRFGDSALIVEEEPAPGAPRPPATWRWDYAVPRSAARGTWRLVAEVDGIGAIGETTFSVEDFVPQRVALDLARRGEGVLTGGEPALIDAQADFLYGAPGAGLRILSEARLETDPSPFEGFEDFRFGRHDARFDAQIVTLPEAVADGEGAALVALDLSGRGSDAQAPLRAAFVARVLEPGGRAVAESLRAPYRPRPLYLGLRPRFENERAPRGETAAFDVAALGPDGAPLAPRLEWRLLKIDYDYDWYREASGEWRWRRTRTASTMAEGVVEADDDAGEGARRLAFQSDGWGRRELIVRDPETGAEASAAFWSGWGGRASDAEVAPDRVEVSGPADPPRPGQDAEIAIVSPYEGEAQIVVATDRVLSVTYARVEEGGAQLRLPVGADWGGGAYVLVTVFTDRDPVDRPIPRRAVGVAHIPVSREGRVFEVALDAPNVARPGETMTVEVAAGGGPRQETAWLTLAAVDEGVLRLTKFESPDPVDWAFGRKALGVDVYDDYGRLLDPNQGAAAALRSGGDQLGGEGLTETPTRTVALFSGPVALDRQGRADVAFELPPFNGELRLMATVWSQSGLGAADLAIKVREVAPAELILPRFLAPGDEAVAIASLDNVEGPAGPYEAAITAEGPLAVTSAGLDAELAPGQRADSPVGLRADAAGIATLRLAATGPRAYRSARDYAIQIRSAFLPVTQVERAVLAPGESFTLARAEAPGLVAETAEATVSFSPYPLDAAALHASLARYPYGCTEQITSRALPLLYADALAASAGADPTRPARAQVGEAVATVLDRVGSAGAIGLWREGDRAASPWLGAYAADFLARAREAGHVVPEVVLARVYDGLQGVARGERWRAYGYDFDQRGEDDQAARERLIDEAAAYAAYVLARAGRMDIGRLRYLHDARLEAIESPLARAHLGAGLAALGDRARAESAFEAAEAALGHLDDRDYYQTPVRDLAGVLALAAEAEMPDRVERLGARLGEAAPEPDAMMTQEKAFALLALAALNPDADAMDVALNDAALAGAAPAAAFVADDFVDGPAVFANRGAAPVWRTLVRRGDADGPPPASASGVSASKSLHSPDGARIAFADVRQGDAVVVRLALSPRERRVNPMIIADLLPAGLEIEAVLRPADAVTDEADGPYAWLGRLARLRVGEARDDRFVAAVDLAAEDAVVAYVARAVTPGRFTLPGVVVEDMYRPQVNARSQAGVIEIVASPRQAL